MQKLGGAGLKAFKPSSSSRKSLDLALISFSEMLYAPGRFHWVFRATFIAALLVISTLIVYVTGGTYLPILHVYYIPIILANFLLGALPGLLIALASGILVGMIPLNVSLHQQQELSMIVYRIIFFILVSVAAGIADSIARSHIDHLRLKVQEKTAELEKNYRELKELQELKEFLTNTLVHDLKASLTSNLVSCDVLNKKYRSLLDENGRSLLETSLASGKRTLNMISNILDLYAKDKGVFKPNLVEWNPDASLQEIAESFKIQAEMKNITLEMELEKSLPSIRADKELIRRTLENLLYNAITHTPRDGRISINAGRKNGSLQVSVLNTGSTIEEKWKEKIFEKFTTFNNDEHLKRGSGLGLALCRMAVEAHGGRIWVDSKNGAEPETVFTFTLPLEDDSTNEKAIQGG